MASIPAKLPFALSMTTTCKTAIREWVGFARWDGVLDASDLGFRTTNDAKLTKMDGRKGPVRTPPSTEDAGDPRRERSVAGRDERPRSSASV